jgi:hypothetical protein
MTSRWSEVVAAARAIVEGCPSGCATACIDCLYTFRNAFYHQHLNRNTAADRLNQLASCRSARAVQGGGAGPLTI